MKTHCKHGHELTEVYVHPTSGAVICRQCERKRKREVYRAEVLNTFRCGHKKTEENTYYRMTGKFGPYAQCKACNRLKMVKRRVEEAAYKASLKTEVKPKPEKFKGIPAGRITYPQYKYGCTRLG